MSSNTTAATKVSATIAAIDRRSRPSSVFFIRNVAYDGHALGLALALAVAGPGAYSLDALRRR